MRIIQILFISSCLNLSNAATLPGFDCAIHLNNKNDINVLLPSILSKMYSPEYRKKTKAKYIKRNSDAEAVKKILDRYDIFKSPVFTSSGGIKHYQINQDQFKKLNIGHKLFKKDGTVFIVENHNTFPDFKVGVVKKWTDSFKAFNEYDISPTSIIRSWGSWSTIKQEPKEVIKILKKKLKNKTLISFDLETSGAARTEQITEIYMKKSKVSFKRNKVALKKQSDFKTYVNANKNTIRDYYNSVDRPEIIGQPTTKEIIELTYYDWSKRSSHESELKVLTKLKNYLSKNPDAIFMAHNAFFDINMLNNRFYHHGINYFIDESRVIDTQLLARYFWTPLKRFSTDTKSKEIVKSLTRIADNLKKDGTQSISYSSRLGDINQAITGNDPTNWHRADADVRAMDEIFISMYEDLAKSKVTQEQLKEAGVEKKFSKAITD